jgi:small subunit ribosomal protein S20|uniref:ribosomal protein S20 n=1 Tax=Gonyostomum semen TaxID=375454 RepID=UPI002115182A|nr:ribosomal protein S20 [Gonyostomum semen]UTE94377.1 ribosomal protein S20 [Gonyostomum semen]
MTNIKSAQKRVQISEKKRIQNRKYKSLIKTYTKKYFVLIEEYKNNPTQELLKLVQETSNKTYSSIDKAQKKNVLHKNTAARKKSQIGSALKGL